MVYFTCNACGESLKKAQVEKHYLHKCRRCEILTCVDCQKDFPGDSYQSHIKCISEDQKYGGQGWTPKAGANKGEKKQQAWIDNLQTLVSDPSQDLDNDVRELLNTIMNHENIPRKRAKFMNFVKNIKRGIRPATIDKTWEFFEQALKPKKVEEAKPSNDEPLKNDEAQNVTQSKKDKKKKKKAIQDDDDLDNSRQGVKMFEGIQEKENNGTASENGDGSGGKKKKKKKSKLAEEVNNLENETSEKNGTKRKRENEDEGEEQPESKRAHSEKFVWEDVVVKILEKKGDMKLNKLKKKVVAEYMSQLGETHKSEETLRVKVDKTLKKSRRFKTLKDVVSLVD